MPKFTAAERNQIQSIVATLSIKRIPDTEILEDIHKKLKKTIGPRELYNVRQRIQKEAQKWYIDLRDSRYAYISTFKERIDSFFFYQKKLHEIINKNANKPDTQIKAISELVRIELCVYNTHKDLANTSFNLEDSFNFDSDLKKEEYYGPSILSDPSLMGLTSTLSSKKKVPIPGDPDFDYLSIPAVAEGLSKKYKAEEEEAAKKNTKEPEKENEKEKEQELVCYCDEGSLMCHYTCPNCNHTWCPEDKSTKQEKCPSCLVVL